MSKWAIKWSIKRMSHGSICQCIQTLWLFLISWCFNQRREYTKNEKADVVCGQMIVSASLPILQPPLCGWRCWWCCFLPAVTTYSHTEAHACRVDPTRWKRRKAPWMKTRARVNDGETDQKIWGWGSEFSDEWVEGGWIERHVTWIFIWIHVGKRQSFNIYRTHWVLLSHVE